MLKLSDSLCLYRKLINANEFPLYLFVIFFLLSILSTITDFLAINVNTDLPYMKGLLLSLRRV